jgi:hypothetical protein
MPLAVAVDMTDLSKTLVAPRRPELVLLSEWTVRCLHVMQKSASHTDFLSWMFLSSTPQAEAMQCPSHTSYDEAVSQLTGHLKVGA